MDRFLEVDEWSIIEESFNPEKQRMAESLFSLGNGRMGQRANFEETYSGDSLQGHYVAGVYYPDKTRVGWWKNGYPEYFAKVVNAPAWIGIEITTDGTPMDFATGKVIDFRRELNMKEGHLQRTFTLELEGQRQVRVEAKRFLSIVEDEIGAIRYQITPLNFSGNAEINFTIDADIENEDSNYDEKFWDETGYEGQGNEILIQAQTRKLHFEVATGMRYKVLRNGQPQQVEPTIERREKWAGSKITIDLNKGEEITLYKYACVLSSENHPKDELLSRGKERLNQAESKGFDNLLAEHVQAWADKWEKSDIRIEGDAAAQQGIRYNIFQLHQTYTGEDERLNIGPKGFTGEKYGGSTYWDTEAYCLPFYLSTAGQKVARQLLVYRHNHLQKAIENAEKLGFKDGAALYPMVTMNGEECHNEWEITFEEIHRNGAIAFAIYNYVRYTGDKEYLADYGFEVLLGIARFWRQRVNFSTPKQEYVILGVTGPNEYENNVNNNWYTNLIASWCLEYTIETIGYLKEHHADRYRELVEKTSFNEDREVDEWEDVIENMHYPKLENTKVFLQQEGYMDKAQDHIKDLDPAERPINQHWSWDRILRSCFIKQADVLQGLYFLEDRFDLETIRENYEFYESRTVHESSLSPCVSSIMAARIGEVEAAYELYLRTARLDLDDYNKEVKQGLHITSMAGTWMSLVQGFGGMRVYDDTLQFNPGLPDAWTSFTFKVNFRDNLVAIEVNQQEVNISNLSGPEISIKVLGEEVSVSEKGSVSVSREPLLQEN